MVIPVEESPFLIAVDLVIGYNDSPEQFGAVVRSAIPEKYPQKLVPALGVDALYDGSGYLLGLGLFLDNILVGLRYSFGPRPLRSRQ